jgi:hypothetical protein
MTNERNPWMHLKMASDLFDGWSFRLPDEDAAIAYVRAALPDLVGRAELEAMDEKRAEQGRTAVELFNGLKDEQRTSATLRTRVAELEAQVKRFASVALADREELDARPAAAPSVAPVSPAPGALSDDVLDEMIVEIKEALFGDRAWRIEPGMNDAVRRVLARAATFAPRYTIGVDWASGPERVAEITPPAAPVEASEALTLRDRFAMAALQGVLANPGTAGEPDDIAQTAFDYADACLAARSAKGGSGQ